jgi:hypothetical protein
MHPYPVNLPPPRADSSDRDYAEFSQLPRLGRTLDRLQRIYGSHRRLQIYDTEYGYVTNPPNRKNHFVSPATAAYYVNWAEYLSWRDPRIATTMQFLLRDPNPIGSGFASGLMFYGGRLKPSYDSYRLPIFLPATSVRRGRKLLVWGCARPARGYGVPQARIEFQPSFRGAFATLTTVTITDPHGYFDLPVKFPSSGAVRLAWSYPSGATVYSRVVDVTVR